ncbi:hypothetical protein ABNE08_21165 [Paenibacillus larvae]
MKKSLTFILLAAMFVVVLSGCALGENIDRYNPLASKTDVYGVVKGEPKLDSVSQEVGETWYSYDLIGYDKYLNKIDLRFSSKEKHTVGTYIKAVKKGSDTRMHDVVVVKKKDVPENILKKLDEK